MNVILLDQSGPPGSYDNNLGRLQAASAVRDLIAKQKTGNASAREELFSKYWALWACRKFRSDNFPNPAPGECGQLFLSGDSTAALILLNEHGYDTPGNSYVLNIAERASKGDPESRALLPYAVKTYQECNSRVQNGGHCEDLAKAGDRVAITCMERRANGDIERFKWGAALVMAGDITHIDDVIDVYAKGGVVPRNEPRLHEVIEVGSEHGHMRSMLAKAAYVQDVDPAGAFDFYVTTAKADNCYGEAMLASSYLVGAFTEVNEAKAYFWWLLASRQRNSGFRWFTMPPYLAKRLADAFGGSDWVYDTYSGRGCPSFRSDSFASLESKSFSQEVKDLLSDWSTGKMPPRQLDRFRDVRVDAAPAVVLVPAKAQPSRRNWKAVVLANPVTLDAELRADVLYDRVAKSVYVVVAAPSKRAFATGGAMAQGSAVAIDAGTLLTNCHIVEGRPDVRVLVGGKLIAAEVRAASIEADTCVLSLPGAELSPVIGTRKAATLRVGEDAYAVGSPRGFTNSLSKGLISQVRSDAKRVLVQTTAQISGGSSGGGLFDRFGNLIGITTFKIANAEGLNFAIAVDEFVVRK
jgi:S1-C subfamily serine protease